MDWKLALGTFVLIFLAELGDKTQLMLISMSARSKSPHMIFFGAVAGLATSTLVAVLVGESVLRAVPLRVIRMGTGATFLGIGLLLMYRALRHA